MIRRRVAPSTLLLLIVIAFVALAFLRPVDHDESQYVAAAVLTAAGKLPYRDYAYLQTPLQPFLFAPVAWLAGRWAWPALRIVNALLGACTVATVFHGARATGASDRKALVVASLFATCDILLFSIAVARNDALPVACFAAAVMLTVATDRSAWRTVAVGGLLALAAAAKVSYAIPAAAFGLYALLDRKQRPALLLAGALPPLLFVAWCWRLAPAGFLFGTIDFPAHAPAQFYADRPWKLSAAAKLVDTIKFLALGAALPALVIVVRDIVRRRPTALDMLLVGALIAALLPSPTWRQYLLPVLPPLFVRLAIAWRAPPGRMTAGIFALFAALGAGNAFATVLAPGTLHLLPALRQAAEVRRAMDAAGVEGPVATLSPQFLPATGRLPDVRFATGPFYFRSSGLLAPAKERALNLVSRDRGRLDASAALIGGETDATSGDAALDAALARGFGGVAIPVPHSGFTLLVRRPAARSAGRFAGAAASPAGARSR